MVKRDSTFGGYKVFTVALAVCLIGSALAHLGLARKVWKARAMIHDKLSSTPAVRLSPTSEDFSIQAIGTSSPQRTITLTNSGTAPLHISNFTITGSDKDDFGLNQNCPSTLATGENCALNPIFVPTTPGPRKSSIVITDNAKGSPQSMVLTGVGTTLSPSETSLSFGIQSVGAGSSVKAITVTNKGSSALHLARIAILGADAGDFSMTSTCGRTLGAGAQCTARVNFKPIAKGMRAASLRFNDEGGGKLQEIGLTGTGTGQGQFMALSPDRTHLINTFTNRPVFITGEAAWSLIAQLSDADVETYLADRAARGFNAIIVNLIEHQYADHAPADFYGDEPFSGATFSTPNEAYFVHADHVISRAAAHGISVFLFPAYLGYGSGQCNIHNEGWGTDMERASEAVMRAWGVYLGNRYKSFPNIIYVIGCDADPRTCSPALLGKLNAVATGIKSVDSIPLMTADNGGQQSSLDVWSGYSWLDISDMYGASNVAKLNSEYTRSDFLPFFQGEDTYEGENSVTSVSLRKRQYWSALSGAYLGSFFGNNPIWCFNETNPASAVPCPSSPMWQSQLGSTGTVGQSWFGKLFRSREHWLLAPDINHTVVTAGYGSGATVTTTARTRDGQTIIAYVPNGSAATLKVNMSRISSASSTAKCWWFNPSNGSTKLIGSFPNSGTHDFTPPDSNDWVLVIDDARANLAAPGSADL